MIVVLVIMSLTGVALYAARSTSTDIEVAGRYKQATQTREIARFGVDVSLAELSRDPTTYVRAMKDPNVFGGPVPSPCRFAVSKDVFGVAIDTGGCFRFAYGGIQDAISKAATPAGLELFPPGDPANQKPSSLGLAEVRPNFGVEMTDKAELDWPVPGFEGGATSNMRFYAVTMTGIGQIVPQTPGFAGGTWEPLPAGPPAPGSPLAKAAYKASVEEIRAQVVVGPLPTGL